MKQEKDAQQRRKKKDEEMQRKDNLAVPGGQKGTGTPVRGQASNVPEQSPMDIDDEDEEDTEQPPTQRRRA